LSRQEGKGKRGRAARLARGAHNPKVGSSNLPPATNVLPPVSSGSLFNAFWSIRTLSKSTQQAYSKYLKRMNRIVDLNDPVKVEKCVLGLECSNKSRNNYLMAYSHYCRANGIEWARPNLRNERYPVKIPTEERINMIISSASPRYATIFHLSKYGLRPDEISKITLRDLDLDHGTLSVRTSKMGLERTLLLKAEIRDLLKEFVAEGKITVVKDRLFPQTKTIMNGWRVCRRKAYNKFKDLELLKIRLYDLRHWFGTTSYIKCRDIFHVQYLMGHRNIGSTLHYLHIAKGLVNYSDDFTVRVASTIEEFTNLLESGFEFVSDYQNLKICRKRK